MAIWIKKCAPLESMAVDTSSHNNEKDMGSLSMHKRRKFFQQRGNLCASARTNWTD